MNTFLAFLSANGTKIIGCAQGTVALLSGMVGLIPETHLKYWLAASAVLTFWRGFINSAKNGQPEPNAVPEPAPTPAASPTPTETKV